MHLDEYASWRSENTLDIDGFTFSIYIFKRDGDLGMYVLCDNWARNDWSYELWWQQTILSSTNGETDVTKAYSTTFHEESRAWGWSSFMLFSTATNPTHGYTNTDGELTLQLDINPINAEHGTPRTFGKIFHLVV